jgi:hypothetical protein
VAASKRLRFEILRRDGHTCRYCGAKSPDVPLRVDHVVPVALGGSDDPSNLVTACEPCNTGKSSVPADAPLVNDVAEKALKWSAAMRLVAEERALQRSRSKKRYADFREEWDSWTNWRGDPFPMADAWRITVDQLLNAGLHMDDLIELVDVAMSAKAKDTWRYWCGCCWTRLRQMQERAAEIVSQNGVAPPPATPADGRLATGWTEADIAAQEASVRVVVERYLIQESVDSAHCPHRDWGGGTCGDPVCRIQHTEALGWMADQNILKSLREDEVIDAAEALIDG